MLLIKLSVVVFCHNLLVFCRAASFVVDADCNGWGGGATLKALTNSAELKDGVASQNPLEPMMILSRVKHLASWTTVRLPMHFTDVCFLSLNVGKWAVEWSTVDMV